MSAEAIAAASREFEKFVEKQDAKGLAELYVDDARFLPPDVPALEGKAAIAAAFQGFFEAGYKTIKLGAVNTEIIGDTAIHQGTYEGKGTTPDGQDFTDVGKTVEIYKKQQDGSWKFTIDMFNRDAPLGG